MRLPGFVTRKPPILILLETFSLENAFAMLTSTQLFFFFALTCPATWVLTFLQREEAERVGGKAEAESRAEARTDRRGEAENCRRRSKKGAVQGIAPAS
jgi:hypothetical protein